MEANSRVLTPIIIIRSLLKQGARLLEESMLSLE